MAGLTVVRVTLTMSETAARLDRGTLSVFGSGLEEVCCPSCGDCEGDVVVRGPDRMFRTRAEFCVVRCRRCAMHYLPLRPTRGAILEYYGASYAPHAGASSGYSAVSRLLRRIGVQRRCAVLLRHRPGGGRLLDVGCATGTFLEAMERHPGWRVHGVELSEAAASLARAKGLSVTVGDFVAADLPAGAFDVVSAWDVLEHMHDPDVFLGRVRELLRPGGVFVLRTPDTRSLNRRLFGRYWAGWDIPRHLCVYSSVELRRALREAGFTSICARHRSGTYADSVISARFWLDDRTTDGRLHRAVVRLLESLPTRVLLTAYATPSEWLGLGHM